MEDYLKTIDEVIEKGPFKDSWDSLSSYRPPEWYEGLKFGIFIHWGIYSVPAFLGEWYSRNMYIEGSPEFKHHIETYGKHKDFGYKDFIEMFDAKEFDPSEWTALFKEAGAQYVVPVAEHHDGFQMYDSSISDWNSFKMGSKRDVLGELTKEFEKAGLINGASSHRAEHWFYMGRGKNFDSDIKEPLKRGDFYWPSMKEPDDVHDLFSKPYPTKEFLDDWLVRTCEIIDKYRPKIIYFDWWIQHEAFKPYIKKLAAYYYNRACEWGTGAVINYKHDAFMWGTAVPDVERGQYSRCVPFLWQGDTSVAKNSWGYTEQNEYKTPEQIVMDLVDIASKNGRLLLNVDPMSSGKMPNETVNILLKIGEWLKVNGEAIYNTRPYRKSQEGDTEIDGGQFSDNEPKPYTSEDIRFMVNGGNIYAVCLNMEGKDSVLIKTLGDRDASKKPNFHGIIKSVKVLGNSNPPIYTRDEKGLLIKTDRVKGSMPVTFKIEVD